MLDLPGWCTRPQDERGKAKPTLFLWPACGGGPRTGAGAPSRLPPLAGGALARGGPGCAGSGALLAGGIAQAEAAAVAARHPSPAGEGGRRAATDGWGLPPGLSFGGEDC